MEGCVVSEVTSSLAAGAGKAGLSTPGAAPLTSCALLPSLSPVCSEAVILMCAPPGFAASLTAIGPWSYSGLGTSEERVQCLSGCSVGTLDEWV